MSFAVVANGDHQTIRWEKNVIPGPLYAWSRWFASVRLSATHDVNADESLVFISAFAARGQGAIYAYQLDLATGRLRQLHTATDVEHPFFLALSPNSKLLFSIHAKTFGGKDHEEVAAYEIVGRAGELKFLNRQSTRGTAACYLDVDATGETVVVANYSTGSVASLPVRTDGSLGEAATFIQHDGASVDPSRQEGPHAHCMVVSPDSRFVFAADLGLDQVLGYRLDSTKATLSPSQQRFVEMPPGSGPRHLTFHPNGKHMYVINELSNSVTLLDFESEAGSLTKRQTISTLPKEFEGTSHCADLKITPNGRFLYGTNRGHDSIAVYEIEDSGRLNLREIEPSLGTGPQNLAITAHGELLLCANMPGDNVAIFRIDPNTGSLTSVGEPISATSPSCIMIR